MMGALKEIAPMALPPYPLPRETRETEILNGSGVATYGPFTLKIFDENDVEVWRLDDGDTDWSLQAVTVTKTAALAHDTFSITFPAVVPLTTKFRVSGRRLHERQVAVTRGGSIDSTMLEKELSKQGAILQEIRRDLGRSVRFPPDFAGVPFLPVLTAGATIIVNDAGDGLAVGPTADEIAAAQGYAESAAASKTDAQTAAGNAESFAAALNFPAIAGADAYKHAVIKADASGYDYRFYTLTAEDFGAVLDGSPADQALIETAVQNSIALGLPFRVPGKGLDPDDGLTVRVPEDFATVQAAHDAMLTWDFTGAVPGKNSAAPTPTNSHPKPAVTISVAEGSQALVTDGIVVNHPFGHMIKLKGRGGSGLTLASFQSAAFTSGVHLIKIRFSTWPANGVAVGDHMRILLPTGTGALTNREIPMLAGIWRIAAVDAGNKDITLAVFSINRTSPLDIATLTGGIYYHLPTGFRLTNTGANGSQNAAIDIHTGLIVEDFYLSGDDGGTNDPETNGFVLRYGAKLLAVGYGGAAEFQRSGYWGLAGSVGHLPGWGFCGNESYGLNCIQGRVDGQYTDCSGNIDGGVIMQFEADASLPLSNFCGNGGRGAYATNGGSLLAYGAWNGNDVGAETLNNGVIYALSSTVRDNVAFDVRRFGIGGRIHFDSVADVVSFSPAFGVLDSGGGVTNTGTSGVPVGLKGNVAWNPASVATGAQTSTTVAVTGAVVGMKVEAMANVTLSGLRLWAEVTAAGTVTCYLSNNTGGALDLGLFTVYVAVTEFPT
jgi:hypothetical protein